MSEEKTPGLLLQSIAYLGQKRILKVLTPECGILSFLANRNTAAVFTTPFIYAEWVYEKSQREIYLLRDATLLDDLSALKKEYSHLVAAGQIAQDLLRTQLPGKACPEPFTLALACLRKLPLFQESAPLLAMFRLKLLFAEGLLSELPPPLSALLHTKSFSALAVLPENKEVCRQADLLFEESLAT
jgi:recombinational DNA repair protein (RecF pathway)